MNIQDILRKGGTRLDLIIDNSEYYDYELVESIVCQIDTKIDISELYNYELVDNVLGKVDLALDYSEFYDYALGDNTLDYIYYETLVTTITGKFLVTEDNYIFSTEDNYMIEYQ
jgi:hypothetical protein